MAETDLISYLNELGSEEEIDDSTEDDNYTEEDEGYARNRARREVEKELQLSDFSNVRPTRTNSGLSKKEVEALIKQNEALRKEVEQIRDMQRAIVNQTLRDHDLKVSEYLEKLKQDILSNPLYNDEVLKASGILNIEELLPEADKKVQQLAMPTERGGENRFIKPDEMVKIMAFDKILEALLKRLRSERDREIVFGGIPTQVSPPKGVEGVDVTKMSADDLRQIREERAKKAFSFTDNL